MTTLQDTDPSLSYVTEYFQSVINTYLGPRLLAEAATVPAIAAIGSTVAAVVSYDPIPYLNEQQFRFPLLAIYRNKEKFVWKTIAVHGNVGEWCVAYILPPLTGGQMERIAPLLKAVGPILQSRIENMFDPAYQHGLEVWKAAGIEEIYLDESTYGSFDGTGNLRFPAWRGKLIVKECFPFSSTNVGLLDFAAVDTGVDLIDFSGSVTRFANFSSLFTTPNFLSGFSMQVAKLPVTVPVSTSSPNNTSETETTGVFFPGSMFLQVVGSFSATYLLEGSVDGVAWVDITPNLFDMTANAAITTITAAGIFHHPISTPPMVRVRCTAYTSGSPTMQLSGII